MHFKGRRASSKYTGLEPAGPRPGAGSPGTVSWQGPRMASWRATHLNLELSRTTLRTQRRGLGSRGQGRGSPLGTASCRTPLSDQETKAQDRPWQLHPRASPECMAKWGAHGRAALRTPHPETAVGPCPAETVPTSARVSRMDSCVPTQKGKLIRRQVSSGPVQAAPRRSGVRTRRGREGRWPPPSVSLRPTPARQGERLLWT